jgi:hypothetical protein
MEPFNALLSILNREARRCESCGSLFVPGNLPMWVLLTRPVFRNNCYSCRNRMGKGKTLS